MTELVSPALRALLTEASAIARATGAPFVVQVVDNAVRGDSRVIKSARSAAQAGFATLILGFTTDEQPEVVVLDGVTAILIPYLPDTAAASLAGLWRRQASWIPVFRSLRVARTVASTRRRPTRSAVGSVVRAEPLRRRPPKWATLRGGLLAQNTLLVPALDLLRPDLVHVHGTPLLPGAIAHTAAARVHRRHTRALYDSHECVQEQARSHPTHPTYRAWLSIERQYIRDADAVITVSTQIAERLRETYSLPTLPGVVTNAPSAVRDEAAPDLRHKLGLAQDVPLAVYSGWLATERGLGTVLKALPELPDLHLAIVTNQLRPVLYNTVRVARSLGVLDRVHFAGYVPPTQITRYLSSATLGLIPRAPGTHLDLSLPTKYREYLHAGLPLVVSTNKAMAEEVNSTGVGEVFAAADVADLVAALRRVLEDPERYRRAITPALLAEHSWEAQEAVLTRRYDQLAGEPRPGPVDLDLSGVGRRLLGERYVAGEAAAESPVDAPFATVSLGIGRVNEGSQAYYWAEAARTRVGGRATSFARERDGEHPPHVRLPEPPETVRRASQELARVVQAYTHVLIAGFVPVFGRLVSSDIEAEIALLRHRGIQVGLVAYGSDVRDPGRHLAQLPQSFLRDAPAGWLESLAATAARNREIATGFDGPVYVASPDLLLDLPYAVWLPAAIDVDRWADVPPAGSERLRVLQLPWQLEPAVPGADETVTAVLDELARSGLIDLVSRPGEAAAPLEELIASADVVVDDLRPGSYGTAAIEAMAAGRVVVGNVLPPVRDVVGDPIPILDATADGLADMLTELTRSPQTVANLGLQGRRFARTWHSGAASSVVLADFLSS